MEVCVACVCQVGGGVVWVDEWVVGWLCGVCGVLCGVLCVGWVGACGASVVWVAGRRVRGGLVVLCV